MKFILIFFLLFTFNLQSTSVAKKLTTEKIIENSNPNSSLAIVHRLLRVLSRELPLQEAEILLDENLTTYMDGKEAGNGKKIWYKWVQFLHYNADKKIAELTVKIEETKIQKDSITIYARWHGLINEKKAVSDIGKVTYQVQNGKIVSIRTHRANYVFIYGDSIAKSSLAYYWLLLRLFLWNCPSGEASDLCK